MWAGGWVRVCACVCERVSFLLVIVEMLIICFRASPME